MTMTTDNLNPGRCDACGKQELDTREISVQIPGPLLVRVSLCPQHREVYTRAMASSRAEPPTPS